MTSFLQVWSSCLKRFNFRASFSVAASTTRSASAISLSSTVPRILARISCRSWGESFPLSTIRSRFFEIPESPFLNEGVGDIVLSRCSRTPAATWAIPLPICPAPTTPIVLISILPPFDLDVVKPLTDAPRPSSSFRLLDHLYDQTYGFALLNRGMPYPSWRASPSVRKATW